VIIAASTQGTVDWVGGPPPRGRPADPAHDLVATLWAHLAPKPRPGTCITWDRNECGMGDVVSPHAVT